MILEQPRRAHGWFVCSMHRNPFRRGPVTPTVVILSFNSSDTLGATIASVKPLSNDIFVVDSGSTDDTVQIAIREGAQVLSHPFENYGLQRNWAINNVTAKNLWQLHLDADEQVSPMLREEIKEISGSTSYDGFLIPRYLKFMGRLLRHNLAPTFHMRLFRTGTASCEVRHYDQHFICSGAVASLKGSMIDDIRMPLTEWTRRHNLWSDAEVKELLAATAEGRIQGKVFGNSIQRKRLLRRFYNGIPLFVRPILLFFYRYIIRLGFLDGKEGLIFCVLQTLWFRFLIDAKLFEVSQREKSSSIG
jgi:glycosyltransferase involved in cell wall biosynthesis